MCPYPALMASAGGSVGGAVSDGAGVEDGTADGAPERVAAGVTVDDARVDGALGVGDAGDDVGVDTGVAVQSTNAQRTTALNVRRCRRLARIAPSR